MALAGFYAARVDRMPRRISEYARIEAPGDRFGRNTKRGSARAVKSASHRLARYAGRREVAEVLAEQA